MVVKPLLGKDGLDWSGIGVIERGMARRGYELGGNVEGAGARRLHGSLSRAPSTLSCAWFNLRGRNCRPRR
jgi:hypothetical protein